MIAFAETEDGSVSTLRFLIDGETVEYEPETEDGSITFEDAETDAAAPIIPILRLCAAA